MTRRNWTTRAAVAVACCAVALPVLAQSGSGSSGTAGQGSSATSTSAGDVSSSAMTDANILALMHEANTGEIQAAQLAEQKAQSTEVKAFARDMVRDHKQLDATGTRIAQQTGVSPQPPAGDTLTQHAQHEAAELQSLSGAAFDRAYMHDQVADHETVLNLLKEAQPQAQHDQVKTAVRTAITKVQEHLDKAQRIDGQLRGTA